MLRTRHALLAAVALVLATGCGSDSTGPSDGVTGTYTLRAVAGDPLPVVVDSEPAFDYTLEVTAGFITLRQNRTFTLEVSFRDTEGDDITEFTEEASGTYTRSGNNITLTADGEQISGTLNGDTLSLVNPESGETLTFRR